MSYLSHLDLLKVFGEPKLEKGMILWDVPTELEIGVIPKKIYCNKTLVQPLKAALINLISSGCVAELKTWDGCFNIRNKRSGGTPSLHSYGVAIDVNAAWNQMGKEPTLSQQFIHCFKSVGFNWGGDFTRKDGMHMELSKETFYKQLGVTP